jgi:hypothetical protein
MLVGGTGNQIYGRVSTNGLIVFTKVLLSINLGSAVPMSRAVVYILIIYRLVMEYRRTGCHGLSPVAR